MVMGDEAGADGGTSAAEEVDEDADERLAFKTRGSTTTDIKTLYIIHCSFIDIKASSDIIGKCCFSNQNGDSHVLSITREQRQLQHLSSFQ